jgi:hypothetical protein
VMSICGSSDVRQAAIPKQVVKAKLAAIKTAKGSWPIRPLRNSDAIAGREAVAVESKNAGALT